MRKTNSSLSCFIGGKTRTFAFKAAIDGKCRGLKIIVGRTYIQRRMPYCCLNGYHACYKLDHVNNYYSFKIPNVELYLIEVLGEVDKRTDKICTNKMKVIKRLTADEFNYFSDRFIMSTSGRISKKPTRNKINKLKEIIKGL